MRRRAPVSRDRRRPVDRGATRRRTSQPVMSRRVVVLPAPFGPSRPKTDPAGTSRSRASTATTPEVPPNRFVRPRQATATPLIAPRAPRPGTRIGPIRLIRQMMIPHISLLSPLTLRSGWIEVVQGEDDQAELDDDERGQQEQERAVVHGWCSPGRAPDPQIVEGDDEHHLRWRRRSRGQGLRPAPGRPSSPSRALEHDDACTRMRQRLRGAPGVAAVVQACRDRGRALGTRC